MIKTNELRIGNIVFLNDKQKVWEIMDGFDIDEMTENSTVDPIPLTEEWLLKFGFEKNEYTKDFRLGKYWVENRYFDSYEKSMFLFGCYQFNKIYITSNVDVLKYVHELQNLYFALTGQELTI